MTWFDFFVLEELIGDTCGKGRGRWFLGVIIFVGAIWIEKFFYYVGKTFVQYEVFLLFTIIILTFLIPYFKNKDRGGMLTIISIVATFIVGYMLYAIFVRHLSLNNIKILPFSWWIGDAIEGMTQSIYMIVEPLPFFIEFIIGAFVSITGIVLAFLLTIIDYIVIPFLIFPLIQKFCWKIMFSGKGTKAQS